jgi:hypothetical protein
MTERELSKVEKALTAAFDSINASMNLIPENQGEEHIARTVELLGTLTEMATTVENIQVARSAK